MKKIISIILTAVMLMSFSIAANAETNSEIMPRWDNISTISNTFYFDGTDGYVNCDILGDAGTTVTGKVRVYRQTASGAWSYVGGDSGSSDTRSLVLSVSFTAISGAYYKSILETTVYKDGVGEDATRTSYKTCP